MDALFAKRNCERQEASRLSQGRARRFLRTLRLEPLEARTLLNAAPTRDPFQISTANLFTQAAPDVAMTTNGDYVAAWAGDTTQVINEVSTTVRNVFFRRYAANGTAKDAAQQQVALSVDNQTAASVGIDAAGNFVVVWVDRNSAGDDDIFFQRFNAAGTALGSPTRVNTTNFSTTLQSDPNVAVTPDGQFIVVWTHQTSTISQDIYYRRFNADGSAKTSTDALVAPTSTNSKQSPSAAMRSNGIFVVTWAEFSGSVSNVFFSVFLADGSVLVGPKLASPPDAGLGQAQPDISMDARGFFDIAWQQVVATSQHDIYIQRFNESGVARSGSAVVVSGGVGDQDLPQIGYGGSQFIVGWREQLNFTYETYYQVCSDEGAVFGGAANFQTGFAAPAFGVAMNGSGEFALAVERPTSGPSVIYGFNTRNVTATAGLAIPAPTIFLLRNSNTSGAADNAFRFSAAVSGLVQLSGDWNNDGVSTIGVYDPSTSYFALSDDNIAATSSFGFGVPGANWTPIVGDWDGVGGDTIGLYDAANGTFYLRNSNSSGAADMAFGFGQLHQQWLAIAGNWDGQGGDTIGLYDPAASVFYLRNSNTAGVADLAFGYGDANRGLRPVVGDWDGDGDTTVGVYDGATSQFLLSDTNSSLPASRIFGFGDAAAGWKPIAGHWQFGLTDSVGLWNPSVGQVYLRNTTTEGMADTSFYYGLAAANWIPLAGDWNRDGVTTIGLYDPFLGRFYLRNSNTPGLADIAFTFLLAPAAPGAHANWLPIVGDWDGDGVATTAIYDPIESMFHVKNSNSTGAEDFARGFGSPNVGWIPIAGDWTNGGAAGIGLYNPVASQIHLNNAPRISSATDATFLFGAAGGNWKPVAGDWNRDGTVTIGLYDNATATYHLRNSNTTGAADVAFGYGEAGRNWAPIVGAWQGAAAASLYADAALDATGAPLLTGAELQSVAAAALDFWTHVGLSAETAQKLAATQFLVADLPGAQLGAAAANAVWIDRDAAGHGWYADLDNTAFGLPDASGARKALDPLAVDRIDLLSTVLHELGHLAGLGDLDGEQGVMSSILGAGTRRLPTTADVAAMR